MKRRRRMSALRESTRSGSAALALSDQAEELIRGGMTKRKAYQSLGVDNLEEAASLRRLQRLEPEVRQLICEHKIGLTFAEFISGLQSLEDQVMATHAFCGGEIDQRRIRQAMCPGAPQGYRRQIIALIKKSQVSKED